MSTVLMIQQSQSKLIAQMGTKAFMRVSLINSAILRQTSSLLNLGFLIGPKYLKAVRKIYS